MAISADSGALPDTKNLIRPPVRARSLANTSRSAMARRNASQGGIDTPARRWFAHCSPTRFAQKKILRLIAEPERAFSNTRAYTFSYSRGTETTIVGCTSPRFAATLSNDSA